MRFLLRLFIVAEDVGQQEPRPWRSWEGMRRLAMSRSFSHCVPIFSLPLFDSIHRCNRDVI
jgi:hypothetical protein